VKDHEEQIKPKTFSFYHGDKTEEKKRFQRDGAAQCGRVKYVSHECCLNSNTEPLGWL
jgi:hypothetical protein